MSKSELKRIAHMTGNQCDGCRAGFPRRLALGGYYYVHIDPLNMGHVVMTCQKDKYGKEKDSIPNL